MHRGQRAAAFLAASAFVLAACAGPDASGTDASGTAESATATPSAAPAAPGAHDLDLVRVPADVATLAEAADRVAPGGTIEIGAGTWPESLLVTVPDVTVRGVDRNEVVIDGEGLRPYGVVGIADGIRIQNLTVTATTFYGVLVTGLHDGGVPDAHGVDGYEPFDTAANPPLQRFAIENVTAWNNGLYGIYAFNAQHGVIRDSYASGSADSGFYVGQCASCDILVTGNVAERNAVGFENANASEVVVAGNRFSTNRVGMTFLSNYVEAFSPQRANSVVANVVMDNTSADSPAQADGGFGTGIGISGGVDNVLRANRIEGNPRAGVLLANTEDLATTGNRLIDTAFGSNGVDVANIAAERTPTTGTCLEGSSEATALPAELLAAMTACAGGLDPATTADALPDVVVPPGMSFLRVPAPRPQPGLAGAGEGPLPATVTMPDLTAAPVPPADLLLDRTGTR